MSIRILCLVAMCFQNIDSDSIFRQVKWSILLFIFVIIMPGRQILAFNRLKTTALHNGDHYNH